jgi:hypothetical protein
MTETVEVRVLGGLPLFAEVEYRDAEPDVGEPNAHYEVIGLLDRHGRPATWAMRRMTQGDWESVEEQVGQSF